MKRVVDLDEGTLRRVDWQELIPATILFRAFPATFKASYLAFGALAVAFFATIFATFDGEIALRAPFEIDGAFRSTPSFFDRSGYFAAAREIAFQALGVAPSRLSSSAPLRIAAQFAAFLTTFWFALAVSRTAVVRLASTSRSSSSTSMKFAARNFSSLLLPILTSVVFYCCLRYFVAFLTAARRSEIAASILETVGAPIAAVGIFGLVVLFAISLFATPLTTAAIAAEKSDGFDAVSRGISYLTQRPLHWLVYSGLSAILVCVGFKLVVVATSATRFLYAKIGLESTVWTRFWGDVLTSIPIAYLGISFVVYSSAIYLILRRSVDGTAFDAFNDDASGKKTRRLRPILQDAQGAPTLADEPTRKKETSSSKENE